MKRNIKTVLFSALSAILALSMGAFAACEKEANPNPTPTPAPTVVADTKVTVTFDANGGTLTGEAVVEVEKGGKVTAPEASKEGYRFLGWYDQAEGGRKISLIARTFDENTTLYARYEKIPEVIQVTFDGNGGKINGYNTTTIDVTEGGKIGSAPVATMANATFDGWYTAADGGEKVDVATAEITEAVTYYAHFNATAALSSVQTKMGIGGYEWGPAIDSLVFKVGGQVAPSSLSASSFSVRSGNTNLTVTDAYTCDANGIKTDSASEYFAVKFGAKYNQLSPFSYNFTTGKNSWLNSNFSFTASLNNGGKIVVGNTTYSAFSFSGSINVADRVVPSTAILNKGTHTYNNLTLTYAGYETEEMKKDDAKNALIIWLHGAGEGGTDVDIALLGNDVTNLTESKVQSHFITDTTKGAYVLAVQTPTMWMDNGNGQNHSGNQPSRYTETLMETIKAYVAANGDIDENRIYVGGCSNGGYMTINMMINYGDYFAAAYPVCEAYMNSYVTDAQIADLATRKIWFTHAANDTTVNPANYTNATYLRLLQAGAQNVYFSYFVDVRGTDDPSVTNYMGHWSWIYTLQDQCTKVQSTTITAVSQLAANNNGGGTNDVLVDGEAVSIFGWLAAQSKSAK